MPDPTDPVVLPISDELDLHNFRPSEVGPLVHDYLNECLKVGITRVRLIHGKGTGTLRKTVHRELDRHPKVVSYKLSERGNWGATVATLDGHGGDGPIG